MKDYNSYDSECNFAADLAGYLYNEIDAAEKRAVEKHLLACESCAGELTAISAARLMVSDWYGLEFSSLPTPNIEFNPRGEERDPAPAIWSLFTGWRFAVPLFTAVAVLLIVGAIIFRDSAGGIDEAAVSAPEISVAPRAKVDASSTVQAAPAYSKPNEKAPNVAEPKTVVPRSAAADVTRTPRGPRLSRPAQRGPRMMPPERSVASKAVPDLSGFEEKEDETLRLEDIFSEIDAS